MGGVRAAQDELKRATLFRMKDLETNSTESTTDANAMMIVVGPIARKTFTELVSTSSSKISEFIHSNFRF